MFCGFISVTPGMKKLFKYDNFSVMFFRFIARKYLSNRNNRICQFFINGNNRIMCKIYSKLIIKTPERQQCRVLMSLLLPLNRFHTFFWRFYCKLGKSKYRLGVFNANTRNAELKK